MDVPSELRQRHFDLMLQRPSMRLYALVDGLQFELQYGARLDPTDGEALALFAGTEDAHLAHAGPWLIDVQKAAYALMSSIAQLEAARPGVQWILSEQAPDAMVRALRQRMYARSPDDRDALLRLWDPRVMVGLVGILQGSQKMAFFDGIEEWHLLDNGQRRWIGRNHVQI